MRTLIACALLSASVLAQVVFWPSGTADPTSMAPPAPPNWSTSWSCAAPDWCHPITIPVPLAQPMRILFVPQDAAHHPTYGTTYVYGMVGPAIGWVPTNYGQWVGMEPFGVWMIPSVIAWPIHAPTSLIPFWSCAGLECWGVIDLSINGLTLLQTIGPGASFAFQELWYVPDQFGGYSTHLIPPVVIQT